VIVHAPASTANLGPGFDCAAAALELWNELHVDHAAEGEPLVTVEGEGASEVPQDAEHLALRAFSLVTSPEGWRFRFVNRIPLERGLGSSAATVAAGVTAGLVAAERASEDDPLRLGRGELDRLERHRPRITERHIARNGSRDGTHQQHGHAQQTQDTGTPRHTPVAPCPRHRATSPCPTAATFRSCPFFTRTPTVRFDFMK